MEKKFVFGAAAICILLFAACHTAQKTTEQAEQAKPQQEGLGKALILYYTWSRQGNTESAARILQGLTGADIVKLEPSPPFPQLNEGDMIAWAREQWEDKAWPKLKDLGVNPASYDFIFVGTPVWFGTISLPIETLLANTDFGGKRVACFAMANSREGEVLKHFGEKAKNARVREGIAFRMQSETQLEAKLAQWVNALQF